MYFEGDLKPAVKRVRPYKTLLLNLPARSFGFWVLANTKINACYEEEDNNNSESVESATVESEENEGFKAKRSILHKDFDEYTNLPDVSLDFVDENDTVENIDNENLVNRISKLNEGLNKVQKLYKNRPKTNNRLKRQIDSETLREKIKQIRSRGLVLRKYKKADEEPKPKSGGMLPNIIKLSKRNLTTRFRNNRHRKGSKLSKNKLNKRHPKTTKTPEFVSKPKKVQTTEKPIEIIVESSARNRRSVDKDQVELSTENEIEMPTENVKMWKILKNIHKQLKDLSEENDDYIEEDNSKARPNLKNAKEGEDNVIENETGFIKTTVGNLMTVLGDLNKNLNKFWNGMKLLN